MSRTAEIERSASRNRDSRPALRLSVAWRMITAELFSDLGNQFIHLTLLAALFFHQPDAFANLLFLCLIQQAPSILLGPAVGKWIDGIGPKRGLLSGILAKVLLAAGLIVARNSPLVWIIYPIFMAASVVFLISRLTMTPHIIPKEQLIRYNAVNERLALGAGIAGPILIGFSLRLAGEGVALTMGLAMYAGSFILLRGLPHTNRSPAGAGPEAKPGLGKRIGPAYLEPMGDARIKTWFLLMGAAVLTGGFLNLGAPVYNKSFFSGDVLAWGAVMSGFQAGSCMAAFLLPWLAARMTASRLMGIAFMIVAWGFALLAACRWLPLFLVVMTGLGGGFTLVHLFLESRIQRDCGEHDRGATLAALVALRGAGLLAGMVIAALVTNLGGIRLLLVMGFLVSAAGAFLARRSTKR